MHNSQIEQLIRVNTLSPIVLTKYVVRHMMADGGGRVVNIASIVGFTGYSGLSVYGATKASMIGFTRSLAREVGRMGVNVNAVAPGFVDTDMTQDLDREHREQIARRSALARLARRRRRGQRGGVPAERQGEEHHRHRAHGRCGQHGMNDSPAKAWLRALELTAPIARHPDRILPTVIEELAATQPGCAGSALRPRVPDLSARSRSGRTNTPAGRSIRVSPRATSSVC